MEVQTFWKFVVQEVLKVLSVHVIVLKDTKDQCIIPDLFQNTAVNTSLFPNGDRLG